MDGVRVKPITHSQGGMRDPILPSNPDIQASSEEEGELEDSWSISLGRPIPLDGPLISEPGASRVRMWIAVVVLAIWALWVILGGIRLALTGDNSMLQSVPEIVTFPVGVVFGYYFAGEHQGAIRRRSRDEPHLR